MIIRHVIFWNELNPIISTVHVGEGGAWICMIKCQTFVSNNKNKNFANKYHHKKKKIGAIFSSLNNSCDFFRCLFADYHWSLKKNACQLFCKFLVFSLLMIKYIFYRYAYVIKHMWLVFLSLKKKSWKFNIKLFFLCTAVCFWGIL